jgi:hypothetical protein
MGEELYSIIKENGFDTLEKQRQIFDKIGGMYKIDDIRLDEILSTKQ